MAYVLVKNGVVKQKQPNQADGFVQAPDHVVPGFVQNADGSFSAPEPTLLSQADEKRGQIGMEYAACLRRGCTYNGVRWTATDASRDVLVELIEVAESEGGPVAILDANGARHDLSLAGLQDLRAAGRQYRTAARLRRLELHGQAQAASSVSDVEAIDATSGWPG